MEGENGKKVSEITFRWIGGGSGKRNIAAGRRGGGWLTVAGLATLGDGLDAGLGGWVCDARGPDARVHDDEEDDGEEVDQEEDPGERKSRRLSASLVLEKEKAEKGSGRGFGQKFQRRAEWASPGWLAKREKRKEGRWR